MKKVFIFLGPPGSGKGTQTSRLADKLSIPHIDTGSLLRKNIQDETTLGKIAKGYIDKGDLKTRAIKVVGTEPTISIPVVGKVAAGEPILATENIEDYMSIGESFFSKDSLRNDNFILKVQGESMINAGINDGDYIIVSKQSTALNGQIVVAMIDGEATVKRFYKEKDYIRLQPENDNMDPIIAKDVQIIGKVIGLFRKI